MSSSILLVILWHSIFLEELECGKVVSKNIDSMPLGIATEKLQRIKPRCQMLVNRNDLCRVRSTCFKNIYRKYLRACLNTELTLQNLIFRFSKSHGFQAGVNDLHRVFLQLVIDISVFLVVHLQKSQLLVSSLKGDYCAGTWERRTVEMDFHNEGKKGSDWWKSVRLARIWCWCTK